MITSDLLYKYFRGDTTSGEEQAIDSWLRESRENAQAFHEAYEMFETLSISMPDSLQSVESKSIKSGRGALGLVKKVRRTLLWTLGNAAAIAAVFFIGITVNRTLTHRELASTFTTLSAPLGQRVDVTLPDGTIVKLNSGASLTYPMRFDDRSRAVSLSGEAYFNVTHDERKPFIVNTFASKVEVLGTQFDVDADEEIGEFRLMLVSGCVRATDGTNVITLRPGESAEKLGSGCLQMAENFRAESLSWTRDLLSIAGVSFEDLMRKMEKAFGVKIVIVREDIPELDCTSGELRLSDGLDYALQTLRTLTTFTYERDYKNNVVTIR